MAGKTGTAQVRKIEGAQRGQSGAWKFRDHGLFICFAPVEAPLYAAAVVIEHGLGGARAAAPVARDCLTYMYDPAKAMATLEALERGWGGNIIERSARAQERLRNPTPIAPVPVEAPATETKSVTVEPAPKPVEVTKSVPAEQPLPAALVASNSTATEGED